MPEADDAGETATRQAPSSNVENAKDRNLMGEDYTPALSQKRRRHSDGTQLPALCFLRVFIFCPPQTEAFEAAEMMHVIHSLDTLRHTDRNLRHADLALNHFTHIVIGTGLNPRPFVSNIHHDSSLPNRGLNQWLHMSVSLKPDPL